MGHGIAFEFAKFGHDVTLYDISLKNLKIAKNKIDKLISSSDNCDSYRKITFIKNLKDSVVNAEIVVEAINENYQAKVDLYSRLEIFLDKNSLIFSNTSSLLPSKLSKNLDNPDRFFVTHYFNPPYNIPLVEIVPALQTNSINIDKVKNLFYKMNKQPILIKKEINGFIANRLQAAIQRESINLVEQEIATPEDVDNIVKNTFGRRLSVAGPFEIWEQIGWDLVEKILLEIFPDLSNQNSPSTLIEEKVIQKKLGFPTNEGFYKWNVKKKEKLINSISKNLILLRDLDTNESYKK
ncbi:MAG: 3-hydroxyacyl-CoA dehydrogenase family protein [SAR202 cluster bacterium]|nr:3-hydroxyacyl-CoA dehydrogenase family protein [SAR202 cluster bacterium]